MNEKKPHLDPKYNSARRDDGGWDFSGICAELRKHRGVYQFRESEKIELQEPMTMGLRDSAVWGIIGINDLDLKVGYDPKRRLYDAKKVNSAEFVQTFPALKDSLLYYRMAPGKSRNKLFELSQTYRIDIEENTDKERSGFVLKRPSVRRTEARTFCEAIMEAWVSAHEVGSNTPYLLLSDIGRHTSFDQHYVSDISVRSFDEDFPPRGIADNDEALFDADRFPLKYLLSPGVIQINAVLKIGLAYDDLTTPFSLEDITEKLMDQ